MVFYRRIGLLGESEEHSAIFDSSGREKVSPEWCSFSTGRGYMVISRSERDDDRCCCGV